MLHGIIIRYIIKIAMFMDISKQFTILSNMNISPECQLASASGQLPTFAMHICGFKRYVIPIQYVIFIDVQNLD